MPLAKSRLEILQVRKLIQCVRDRDVPQIEKMAELGLLGVLDFQGVCVLCCVVLCCSQSSHTCSPGNRMRAA